MPTAKKESLTKLELQLMQVLWRNGPSNVTRVQEGLKQDLAYTTVQTMLNILHKKAKLKRKLNGRSFEYTPTITEPTYTTQAVRDLIDRTFSGSSEELMLSLIKSKYLDPTKIKSLVKRAKDDEKKSPKQQTPPPKKKK